MYSFGSLIYIIAYTRLFPLHLSSNPFEESFGIRKHQKNMIEIWNFSCNLKSSDECLVSCLANIIIMSEAFSLDSLKRLELHYIEIDTVSLSSFSNRRQLPPIFSTLTEPLQSQLLRRLGSQDVRVFSGETNSNLQAYSYMLLTTIYDANINESMLGQLKTLLYDRALVLTDIKEQPFPELSNEEMKKLMVEFVFQLQFTDHRKALPRALKRHPVIIHILVLFLRALLVRFGIGEAGSYNQPIPTESAFEVLSELLDITFRLVDGSYVFPESHCVIHQENGRVLVGHYLQSKPASLSSDVRQEGQKGLLKMPSFTRKDHNFNFSSNIRESLCHQYDAPTPFFNLSGELRPDISQKDSNGILNVISSVPQLKYGFRVSQDDENEANQSFEEKLTLLKNEESGWKSPIYNNGVILDDADNAFHLFEAANHDAFTRKTSKGSLDNQIRIDTEETHTQLCSCLPAKKQGNKLQSRVYQVNVQRQRQSSRESCQISKFDCMISSIKNVFSLQAPLQQPRRISKPKRAQTFYEFQPSSLSDFDKSFESYEARPHLRSTYIPASPTNKMPKQQSRILIGPPVFPRFPKIKFTYSTNKL